MGDYKCSKCGEEIYDYSTTWGGHYVIDGHEIRPVKLPCYCYHCHKYTAAQVGIKQQHLQKQIAALNSQYSFFDKLFNTKVYQELANDVKTVNLLSRLIDRCGETLTSCIHCGCNAILLVDTLDNMPHNEKCGGKLTPLPKVESNTMFRLGSREIFPATKPLYKFQKSQKIEEVEKDVIKYFHLWK